MSKRTGSVILLLLAVACGAPTVDVSSDEAFNESLSAIREDLSDDQREAFDRAIGELAMAGLTVEGLMAQAQTKTDITTPSMKDRLAGKTGEEILAEAEALRLERKREELAKARETVAELEAKQAAADQAGVALARFEVRKSAFRVEESRFGLRRPIIEITAHNGLDAAVSEVRFHAKLASPGRSVPWVETGLTYPIRGGIEPGETAEWSLSMNGFSPWGSKEITADALLTLEVVRVNGADGEPMFDAEPLSKWEIERLEKLRASIAELEADLGG